MKIPLNERYSKDYETRSSRLPTSYYPSDGFDNLTALERAVMVRMKSVDVLKLMIASGSEITQNVIVFLSDFGNLEIINHVFQTGKMNASLSAMLMEYAIRKGKLDILKYLESKCNEKSQFDWLNIALSGGNLATFKYLFEKEEKEIQKNTNENPFSFLNTSELIFKACKYDKFEILRYLIERGSEFDGKQNIFYASQAGFYEIVKYLISKGIDINQTNESGQTPLLVATKRNHFEIAKFLIENGATLNCTSNHGDFPISIAADLGYLKILKLLVEHGANIDKQTFYGETPVWHASCKGEIEVVRFLYEQKADCLKPSSFGTSPILIAIQHNRLAVVRFFVEKRIGINDKEKLLENAVKFNHLDIVKFLVSNGFDQLDVLLAAKVMAKTSQSSNEIIKFLSDSITKFY